MVTVWPGGAFHSVWCHELTRQTHAGTKAIGSVQWDQMVEFAVARSVGLRNLSFWLRTLFEGICAARSVRLRRWLWKVLCSPDQPPEKLGEPRRKTGGLATQHSTAANRTRMG